MDLACAPLVVFERAVERRWRRPLDDDGVLGFELELRELGVDPDVARRQTEEFPDVLE